MENKAGGSWLLPHPMTAWCSTADPSLTFSTLQGTVSASAIQLWTHPAQDLPKHHSPQSCKPAAGKRSISPDTWHLLEKQYFRNTLLWHSRELEGV